MQAYTPSFTGGEPFSLEHNAYGACGIPDHDTVILTGGLAGINFMDPDFDMQDWLDWQRLTGGLTGSAHNYVTRWVIAIIVVCLSNGLDGTSSKLLRNLNFVEYPFF